MYSPSFFFSLPDVITKIIPTTSLLLRNLKKRELFQKSEVLFQLLILLSAYQRISCQSHFQREVARKLLNAELEREEAMLSQLEQLWIWAIESDDGVSFSSASVEVSLLLPLLGNWKNLFSPSSCHCSAIRFSTPIVDIR